MLRLCNPSCQLGGLPLKALTTTHTKKRIVSWKNCFCQQCYQEMTKLLQFLVVCNTNFVTNVVDIRKRVSIFWLNHQTFVGNGTLQIRNEGWREWHIENWILHFQLEVWKIAVRVQKRKCQWCFETHISFIFNLVLRVSRVTWYLWINSDWPIFFFPEWPDQIFHQKKNLELRLAERVQIFSNV